jgi:transposase InsO family protein
VKYAQIHRLRHEPSVVAMCRLLGVSESGYFAWRKRPQSPRAKANARLALEIKAAHERTRRTNGPERLQSELADNGIRVGIHRIKRIRRAQGLRRKQKRRFRVTTDSKHTLPVAPNRLARQFSTDAPDKVWVADLTYIDTAEGWLYLAGIKDLFNGELVGYAMSERMTADSHRDGSSACDRCQATWPRSHSSLRSWQSILCGRLPEAHAAAPDAGINEPQGKLLGQRADGERLGHLKVRACSP